MIFDTDIFILAQRGNHQAAKLIDSTEQRFISVMTYMEFLQGVNDRKQLKLNQSFLRDLSFVTLPLTENIGHRAAVYIEEYALSHGMRAADAIIAATATENNMPLASANTKHFRHIQDIELVAFKYS